MSVYQFTGKYSKRYNQHNQTLRNLHRPPQKKERNVIVKTTENSCGIIMSIQDAMALKAEHPNVIVFQ